MTAVERGGRLGGAMQGGPEGRTMHPTHATDAVIGYTAVGRRGRVYRWFSGPGRRQREVLDPASDRSYDKNNRTVQGHHSRVAIAAVRCCRVTGDQLTERSGLHDNQVQTVVSVTCHGNRSS